MICPENRVHQTQSWDLNLGSLSPQAMKTRLSLLLSCSFYGALSPSFTLLSIKSVGGVGWRDRQWGQGEMEVGREFQWLILPTTSLAVVKSYFREGRRYSAFLLALLSSAFINPPNSKLSLAEDRRHFHSSAKEVLPCEWGQNPAHNLPTSQLWNDAIEKYTTLHNIHTYMI